MDPNQENAEVYEDLGMDELLNEEQLEKLYIDGCRALTEEEMACIEAWSQEDGSYDDEHTDNYWDDLHEGDFDIDEDE